MLNSQSPPQHVDNDLSHHGENKNIALGNVAAPVGLDGVPAANPIEVSSHVAINGNVAVEPESIIRGGTRSTI